jgi:hypothetical protein
MSFDSFNKYSTYVTPEKRIALWNFYFRSVSLFGRYGNCIICKSQIDNETFKCAFYISRARGGTDDIKNLRPVCNTCNTKLGDHGISEIKSTNLPHTQSTMQSSTSSSYTPYMPFTTNNSQQNNWNWNWNPNQNTFDWASFCKLYKNSQHTPMETD